jgi:hypothetical protein
LFPDGHPAHEPAPVASRESAGLAGENTRECSAAAEAVANERHLHPAGHLDTVVDLQALARAQAGARQFGPARSSAGEAAAMVARLAPDDTAAIGRAKDLIASIEKSSGGAPGK